MPRAGERGLGAGGSVALEKKVRRAAETGYCITSTESANEDRGPCPNTDIETQEVKLGGPGDIPRAFVASPYPSCFCLVTNRTPH